jgi:hypothetical protein
MITGFATRILQATDNTISNDAVVFLSQESNTLGAEFRLSIPPESQFPEIYYDADDSGALVVLADSNGIDELGDLPFANQSPLLFAAGIEMI